MNRSRACAVCGRTKVPMVYVVGGGVWGPGGWPWVPEQPPRRRVAAPTNRSIAQRTRAKCLFTADCRAAYEARRDRQQTRAKLPEDAALRKLHKAEGGRCKWCGEPIYRVNKGGRVVVNRRRMWHEGREVHPDAEPEPRCVQAYNAQGFTFREQVGLRDKGVCAACGRDCEADLAAWRARNPSRRDAAHKAWLAEEPVGWQADHIVPLEDGGEHLLANAQTLCEPCHLAKTARENSERAARRRGDSSEAPGEVWRQPVAAVRCFRQPPWTRGDDGQDELMGRGMIATAAGLLIAEHAWVLLALLLVLAALTLLLHAGPGHAVARVIGERRRPSAEAWFAREMVAKGRRDLMVMEYVQDLELEFDYRLGLKQRPEPVRTTKPVGEFGRGGWVKEVSPPSDANRPRGPRVRLGHNHPAGMVCGESCPLLREVMRGGGLPQRTAADALPMYAVCASCGRTFGEHSPFGPWNGACGEFRVQTPACVDVARELGAYPPLPTDGSSE